MSAGGWLTTGGVGRILAGDLDLKPVLQLLNLRRVNSNGKDRYRAVVSDGALAHNALLAEQLNPLASTGLRRGAVVQLLEYVSTKVQDQRIIFILNLEVLDPERDIIGDPKLHSDVDSVHFNSQLSTNSIQPRTATSNGTERFGSSNRPDESAHSFQPVAQPSYKPPPSYKNHGAIMKNDAPAKIIPIAALNPYLGRWAIKARVTAKGDIRRYNNAKGDGKVFSFDLLDSDGGEIRVTCFNALVDRFYQVIEVGKVYMISRGSLKPAQRNFNHLNNEWEIFLENASTVEACPDEDSSIPAQRFSFRPIAEIENAQTNAILDIIGIVTAVNPSTTIVRKTGMETQRRVIHLKDMSDRSVELTMWGEFCNKEGMQLQEMVDSGAFPVLAVKAGKVSDFNGKSVGTISSTQLFIDPELPEAHGLRQWFNGVGRNTASQSITRDIMPSNGRNEVRKTVAQIKDEGLGLGDKPDWVTVKAALTFIKTDAFCYTACPLMIGDRQCSKKVSKLPSGNWSCDRCDREFEECDYRFLLQLHIQDHTGLTSVTAFQESGEEILNCSAKELYRLKECDEERFTDIFRSRLFLHYMMLLKIKEETYGEERKVKITVIKAGKIDPSAESRRLVEMISTFGA